MFADSRPERAPEGVSRKMMVVLVAMFAVIIVPVAATSLPSCRIIVSVTNLDTESMATCDLGVYWHGQGSSTVFSLEPGEERVQSYWVKPGQYDVNMYYWFQEQNYTWTSFSEWIRLTVFETERVEIELVKWY